LGHGIRHANRRFILGAGSKDEGREGSRPPALSCPLSINQVSCCLSCWVRVFGIES
jgi:hypothetical protein